MRDRVLRARKAERIFLLLAVVSLMASGCATGANSSPGAVGAQNTETKPQADTAWQYLDQDRPAEALDLFRKLAKENGASTETRLGFAEAMRLNGDTVNAEAEYTAILEVPMFRARALEGIGLVRLQNGDTNGALERLLAATTENRRLWRAWLGLAQLNDMAHDWDKADAAYVAALAASDKPKLVYNNHGISMLARGKPDEAAALFEKAIQLDPGFEQAVVNLELANAARGQGVSATAVDPDPKSEARRLNNIGYVAMLRGDYRQAEASFERALKTNPTFYSIAFRNLQVLKSLQLAGGSAPAPNANPIHAD